jgi:hypothetical protein
MKGLRWILVAGAGIALVTLSMACGGNSGETAPADDVVIVVTTPRPELTPRARSTPPPTPEPSPTPLHACGPNPDPAPRSLLQIVDPQPEARIKSPVHVRGWGSDIGRDNLGVALAVLNARGDIMQVLDLPPQPRTFRTAPPGLEITEHTRPFAADVVIGGVSQPTPFCIWVYSSTTEDGTPRGVLQLPILVTP